MDWVAFIKGYYNRHFRSKFTIWNHSSAANYNTELVNSHILPRISLHFRYYFKRADLSGLKKQTQDPKTVKCFFFCKKWNTSPTNKLGPVNIQMWDIQPEFSLLIAKSFTCAAYENLCLHQDNIDTVTRARNSPWIPAFPLDKQHLKFASPEQVLV